jgi:sterol desaturase/sphingolipid hydroxylase (fatty acid hydroxylase superfamily)
VRLVEDHEDRQYQSGHGAAGGQHCDDRGADDDDEAAQQRWRLVLSEPPTPVRMTVRRSPLPPASAGFGGVVVEPDRRAARLGPWLGVLGVAAAAAWFGWTGWRALSKGGGLWHSLATDRAVSAGPVLFAVVAAIFLAERLWPAVRRPALARAHVVDAGYLALFAAVVAPLVTLVNTGFGVEVGRHAHFLVLGRLSLLPRVVVVGVILAGIDAMNWAAHVANHRSAALWRLHALHHSQEDMNVFTTFRTHPLAHASYLPALIPVLVLGASGPVPATALIVYGCLVTLPHANLRWSFGPIGRIIVSPAYHRLHHARTALDDRGAVNFGFVLVCWDRLARLAILPDAIAKVAPIPTGIGGRPVPIEQTVRWSGTAGVVLSQLAQPFRAKAATDGGS